MAEQNAGRKGKQKASPKIKRAGRASQKTKYNRQIERTYRNKLRRIRRCNGPAAAEAYVRQHYLGK